MAKTVHNDVLDAALDKIATATVMTICSQQPTTRTEAVTTFMLVDVTMTAGDGNGDYTIADGDVSGRKLTVTAQASEEITNTGDGTYVALCDGSDLLFVTTGTFNDLVDGNTVNIPAFDVELRDPT